MNRFKNKTVVVTGGASGMGEAIAKKFIEDSAEVIVFDVQRPNFDCTYYNLDIRNEDDILKAFKAIPTLDILVNNAGIYFQKSIEETSKDEIDKIIDINIKGPILMCKHSLKLLKESKGTIINIASCLALITEPGSTLYSTTKAGVLMLTKSLAVEYAPDNIRVNAVLPGPIDTPLLRNYLKTDKEVEAHGKKKPFGRVGKPEEVANMVSFLASEEASYITGGIFSVDGGESATSLYTP
jgi:NAD(P)-dependent dehydrogenase (short-subunit alcohol dehydrogenase family)